MSFKIAYKIYCQSRFETGSIIFAEWQSYGEANNLEDARQKMYQCADEDESRQMIGIFRNRPNWDYYKPMYLIDRRENKYIRGLEGLINSLDSSWF